ncbi:hypothetical protein L2E82_02245 [Cichorium intybus]|uniref:Uncharacterized protein n=1 Tax=Cichorium intybus TaxID=13427 RepID=A0ACB9H144_CICIN|nr:hypothetical protein L2E82_02245 [Cichorium intybus]
MRKDETVVWTVQVSAAWKDLMTPRAIHGVSRGSDAPTHGGDALSYSPLLSATENIFSIIKSQEDGHVFKFQSDFASSALHDLELILTPGAWLN